MKIKYNIYNYENGIRLLTLPDKNINSMILYVYVKVGSKYEPVKLIGLSHLLEHLLFKGSEKYKNHTSINTLLDSNGVNYNAFTDKNMTVYHYKFIPNKDKVKLVFDIAFQMIFKSLIREKDIKLEKSVVTREYNDMIDDPAEYIEEIIEELAFKGHVLEKSVIGTPKSVNNSNQKDIRFFYDKYYVPENVLVTLGGNLPSDHMELINKYFIKSKITSVKPGNKTIDLFPQKLEKLPLEKRISLKSKKIEHNQLAIFFNIGGVYEKNMDIYRLIANILGGSMSSRLFVRIREKLGLVYDISCSVVKYEEHGYFLISTQVKPKDMYKCLEYIMFELKKICNYLPALELKNNKQNYCDLFLADFDNLENKCEFYSEQLLLTGKIMETNESRVEKIKKITIDDVLSVSKCLFTKENIKIACYGTSDHKKILKKIIL